MNTTSAPARTTDGDHLGVLFEPLRHEGSRLDTGVRADLEHALGASFGDVIVHTGSASAAAAEKAAAAAFTVGRHIVFGPEAYAPRTPRGRMLLAHELAHVEQQRRSGGPLDLGTSGPEASTGQHITNEQSAAAAASLVADGASTSVSGSAPVGIAKKDKKEEEKSWRQKLWEKTKEKVRDGAKRTLGQIEGIAIEAGQIVDTVVWVPYAAMDATDALIDAAGQKLGVTNEITDAIKSSLPGTPALKALRAAAKEAGMVDPDTGAPIISDKITEGFTAVENALDKTIFKGMKKEEGFFTQREIGQLEGAIGTQLALSFVGVAEIQLALKVASAVGIVKSIVVAIERNPKGFATDRNFWTAVANAFLHVAGLKSASSGKKIVALVVDIGATTLSSTNEIMQLREDWAKPPGPERDRALAKDVQGLIRVLAGAVQQAISHHKSLKASGAKTAAPGAESVEGPPVAAAPAKGEPATGTEAPPAATLPVRVPALEANMDAAPKVRTAVPQEAPPKVGAADIDEVPRVRVAGPQPDLPNTAPTVKNLSASGAETEQTAKKAPKPSTESTEPAPQTKGAPSSGSVVPTPPTPKPESASPLKTFGPPAPAQEGAALPAKKPHDRALKKAQVSTKAARKRREVAVVQKKLADAAVVDAKRGVADAQDQLEAAKRVSAKAAAAHAGAPKGAMLPAQKAATKARSAVKAAERDLTRADKALAAAKADTRTATAKNMVAKTILPNRTLDRNGLAEGWDYTTQSKGPRRRWQVSDPINMPSPRGVHPTHATVTKRLWKTKAVEELNARKGGDSKASERLLHLDPIEELTTAELQAVAKTGKMPARVGAEVEHSRIPQRIGGLLEKVGLSPTEARVLSKAGDPSNLEPTIKEWHAVVDAEARTIGTPRNPSLPMSLDDRLERPLGSATNAEIAAIAHRLKGPGVQLNSPAGKKLREILAAEKTARGASADWDVP
jgi:hypothetical protein